MKITRGFAPLFVVAALASGAAQANLLADGDFESFDSLVASGGFTKVNPGALGAWTVGATSVDLIQNAFGSINNVSIDLSGSPGPGSLSQAFDAIAGYTYTLTWDYFRNGAGTDLGVTLGALSTSFAAPTVITAGSLVWTAASTGQQFVSFAGGSGNQGPTLDNVVLTAAIPEPETYALILAGLGLVGFIARRRRPQS